MVSQEEIQNLFAILKTELEFDGDIVAITKILKAEFKNNIELSLNSWKELLTYYDFQNLKTDMDISPLFGEYPLYVIEHLGLAKFFKIMESLSSNNQFLIANELFKSSIPNTGLYLYLEKLIINNAKEEELKTIDTVLNNITFFPQEIFDLTDFLRQIMLLHIKYHKLNKEHLLQICLKAPTLKSQALLKTLLIASE